MIRQFFTDDKTFPFALKSNHYSRRIKSHFQAYGTEYEFARFFEITDKGDFYGIISVFNSSMMISTAVNRNFTKSLLDEIGGFVLMNKPELLELEPCYAKEILDRVKGEYTPESRTEFEFVSHNTLPDLTVNEIPKLDDVFAVLKTSFPSLAEAYELWLTDTSHRVRRGLAQSFLLGNYTTATIQYIIDGVALIGHVATVPEERGKFHARTLLYWIGEKLTMDGFTVKLMARPHRVSYYEEIGFKAVSEDTVLERKKFDE